jgi:hypothetical protein
MEDSGKGQSLASKTQHVNSLHGREGLGAHDSEIFLRAVGEMSLAT